MLYVRSKEVCHQRPLLQVTDPLSPRTQSLMHMDIRMPTVFNIYRYLTGIYHSPVFNIYRYAGPGESKHPRAVESKSGIYHFLVVEIPLGLQHRKSRNPRLSRQNFIGQPIAGMKYDIGEVGFQRAQQAQEILGISCGGFLLQILNFWHFCGGLCHIKRRPR